jgi:hypothetical protein
MSEPNWTSELAFELLGRVEVDERTGGEAGRYTTENLVLLEGFAVQVMLQQLDVPELRVDFFHAENKATGRAFHSHVHVPLTVDDMRMMRNFLTFMLGP